MNKKIILLALMLACVSQSYGIKRGSPDLRYLSLVGLTGSLTVGGTLDLTGTGLFKSSVYFGTSRANAYLTINPNGNTVSSGTLVVNGATIIASTVPLTNIPINLSLYDTASWAMGNGGAIGFFGDCGDTGQTYYGGIQGFKENATQNNYSTGLKFRTRISGSQSAVKLILSSAGNLTINPYSVTASTISANGDCGIANNLSVRQNLTGKWGKFTSSVTVTGNLQMGDGSFIYASTIVCSNVIDYSPVYSGDALTELKSIKPLAGSVKANGWGEVDHSALSPSLAYTFTKTQYRNKQTAQVYDAIPTVKADREVVMDGITEIKEVDVPDDISKYTPVIVKTGDGRNISNQVQLQQAAIMQLLDKITVLEEKIAILEK